MTTHVHTKITRTIAAAIAAAAVAAPLARATEDETQAATSIAGRPAGLIAHVASTRVTIPARFTNFHEPGSTGFVPRGTLVETTAAADGGLDWVSALVGAGATLGIGLASAGALTARRKRRPLYHV